VYYTARNICKYGAPYRCSLKAQKVASLRTVELSNNLPALFLGEHDKTSLELEAHAGDVNLIRPHLGFSLPLLVRKELSHTVVLFMRSVADPGSRVDKIPDPDLHHRV
jgi:hypothetical protein